MDLPAILEQHRLWLAGVGGSMADVDKSPGVVEAKP
jgi:hypothetical protein